VAVSGSTGVTEMSLAKEIVSFKSKIAVTDYRPLPIDRPTKKETGPVQSFSG
jgi:hypothetical protein